MLNAIDIVSSLVDSVSMLLFLFIMFGARENRKRFIFIFVIIQFFVAYILGNEPIFQMLLYVTVNFLFCRICLEGSRVKNLCWSVFDIIPPVVISVVTLVLFSLFLDRPIIELLNYNLFLSVFISVWVHLIEFCIYFLCLKSRAKQMNLGTIEWLLIFLLLTADIIILGGLLMIDVNLEISGKQQRELFAIALLTMVILLCCIIICVRISRLNVRLRENEQLLLMLENQKDMITQAHEMQEETRIIRHDMKHYVNIWTHELEAGHIDMLKLDMKRFTDEISTVVPMMNYMQGCEVINTVLYSKFSKCKEYGIKYEVEITTCFSENVEMDVAIVIANLLDNAINAQKNVAADKRFVSLCMFQRFQKNNIIVSNYINESVLKNNPKLKTTRKDKRSHGLGLKSVQKIVEKYRGSTDISEEGNLFIVHIMGL